VPPLLWDLRALIIDRLVFVAVAPPPRTTWRHRNNDHRRQFRGDIPLRMATHPWMTRILHGGTLLALLSAIGCGGIASSSPSGDEGSLASCGDNCSAAQVSASCSDICARIAQTGCSVDAQCPMNCAAVTSMAPSCVALVDGFLRCVESVQPICSAAGMVQFVGCDSQQQALDVCIADSGSSAATTTPTTPTPTSTSTSVGPPTAPSAGAPTSFPGGPCADVPANVCPAIPRAPVGVANPCSGGGGGGPNGTTTSQTTCEDGAGNVWQSECAGSTCTCAYNGGQACTCTITTPPNCSCCPGID
jgi:hypothetical protein